MRSALLVLLVLLAILALSWLTARRGLEPGGASGQVLDEPASGVEAGSEELEPLRLPERQRVPAAEEDESVAQVPVDGEAEAGSQAPSTPQETVELWFVIRDENEQPLEEASLTVLWDGGQHTAHPREEDGLIWVGGVPPGLITFEARSEGFATARHAKRVPAPRPSIIDVTLTRSAILSGDVVLPDGGVPDGAIEVVHQAYGFQPGHVSVVDSPDLGRAFRIEDAHAGRVNVVALSDRYGISSIRKAELVPGEETRVRLLLSDARAITGQVVAAEDGRPLADARARIVLEGIDVAGAPSRTDDPGLGAPQATCDAEGHFALEAGVPDEALVEVWSEGYSAVQRRVQAGNPRDLGTVELVRSQTLGVRLVFEGGLRTGWEFGSEEGAIPRTPFGADGCLTIEGVSAGELSFWVSSPEGNYIVGTVNLYAGKDWLVEIPVDGLGAVLVDFALTPPASEGLTLFVNFQPSPDLLLHKTMRLADLAPQRFEGIPRVRVGAQLVAGDGHPLGQAAGEFAPGSSELRLTIGEGRAATLRVVDAEGSPLAGAMLYVGRAGDQRPGASAFADDQGLCTFEGLPDGELVAMLTHPRGNRPGIPIETGDEAQTIVLDPSGSIRITVTDEGVPLPGVSCLLCDPKANRALLDPVDTDGRGVVSFTGLHEGTYLVQPRRDGYANSDRELRVAAGQNVELVIEARKAP